MRTLAFGVYFEPHVSMVLLPGGLRLVCKNCRKIEAMGDGKDAELVANTIKKHNECAVAK